MYVDVVVGGPTGVVEFDVERVVRDVAVVIGGGAMRGVLVVVLDGDGGAMSGVDVDVGAAGAMRGVDVLTGGIVVIGVKELVDVYGGVAMRGGIVLVLVMAV